jgi:hypothetical protein
LSLRRKFLPNRASLSQIQPKVCPTGPHGGLYLNWATKEPKRQIARCRGRLQNRKMTAMDLIFGTRQITPDAITRTTTGVGAVQHGEALISLLNAAFNGAGTIEILGGDLNRHWIEVTEIEMQGRETRVTLTAMGAGQRLL